MNLPKGKLIAVGGNEDKGTEEEPNLIQRANLNFFELGILKRIGQEAKGADSKIEVITTASSIPVEVGFTYLKAFCKAGLNNIGIMHIKDREDVKKPEYHDRIRKADVVLFSGGNQLRLSMIFGGTEFHRILMQRYQEEEFIIAGTSAGAMAMSGTMI